MEIVVSGIRPTGNLHLGNYFGAMQNFLKMQDAYRCYFFIADYHSLTTHPHPADLHATVKQVLVEYLACGLDPDKATIYLQSDLPETAEVYLLLNMNAYVGELSRSVSFKEKVRSQPNNVNAGLLTYPVLMAADILIHRAQYVPVGKDQMQHLEFTRDFAQRFNNMFDSKLFPEPQAFNFGQKLVKVPGLDGVGKMSKSESGSNAIFLIDSDKDIEKKIKGAKTDSGPTAPNQPLSPEIENLFMLMSLVGADEQVKYFREKWDKGEGKWYGELKKQLIEELVKFISPLRQRIEELKKDEDYISKVVKNGAEKARESASATLRIMRETIGFRKFY
jgi:tryptophanyl-tRNA synthetase